MAKVLVEQILVIMEEVVLVVKMVKDTELKMVSLKLVEIMVVVLVEDGLEAQVVKVQ